MHERSYSLQNVVSQRRRALETHPSFSEKWYIPQWISGLKSSHHHILSMFVLIGCYAFLFRAWHGTFPTVSEGSITPGPIPAPVQTDNLAGSPLSWIHNGCYFTVSCIITVITLCLVHKINISLQRGGCNHSVAGRALQGRYPPRGSHYVQGRMNVLAAAE